MKLKYLKIINFKGIKKLEIDFMSRYSENPRRLTVVMGDNGAGKTTVLQAIALVLAVATRKIRDLSGLQWQGFLPERIASLGPTLVEITVGFDDLEIAAMHECFELWRNSRTEEWTRNIVEPDNRSEVTLRLENGSVKTPDGPNAYMQFLGRYYIKQLKDSHPHLRSRFKEIGDVFWFDQFRNLGGVEELREYLLGWWGYHTSLARYNGSHDHAGTIRFGTGRDYISELEPLFKQIFPATRFVGSAPKPDADTGRISDFYFLLERDRRTFDIAEMSSGEQGVFPLFYEFIRLDVAKSIVMIDELELHLHPPQQQALLAALPKLGPDCQFIITTHSSYLESVIPDEDAVRLEGGRLCL